MQRAYLRHMVDTVAFFVNSADARRLERTPYVEVIERGSRHLWEAPPWIFVQPVGVELPEQGWKVHVAATLDNAEHVLRAVDSYCARAELTYKCLRSRADLLDANSKEANRASSGKFVAIYPPDEAALRHCLEELGETLEGSEGPYILSDLRWRQGPLFVRYGGFVPMPTVEPGTDEETWGVRDPSGRLVPDRREPFFTVPDWVPVPDFIEAQRQEVADRDEPFPYEVIEALRHSNAGGVYLAKDPDTGDLTVLKEARPHAGLDARLTDAVERLGQEADVLEAIADTGIGPRLLARFSVWEHRYVAMEHIDGTDLLRLLHDEHPWLRMEHTRQDFLDYVAWADGICSQVDEHLRALHALGLAFGDLHPKNIMVQRDGRVRLIDFEAAGRSPERVFFGNPGFNPPVGVEGADADVWAAACVRLHLLLPLTPLVMIDHRKLLGLVDFLRGLGTPSWYLDPVEEVLALAPDPGNGADAQAPGVSGSADLAAMARGILASARDDPAAPFPGDIKQFETSGLCFAYGSSGVLTALAEAGVSGLARQWNDLLRVSEESAGRLPPGLMVGRAGISGALARQGLRSRAQPHDEIDDLRTQAFAAGWDLHAGATGVALHLADIADAGNGSALGAALDIAERVWVHASDHAGDPADLPAGLMYGRSGPALLFTRLFAATSDEQWAERAAVMLRTEQARAEERDGGMLLSDGRRVLPYIANGSAGFGIALIEHGRATGSDEFVRTLRAIDKACRAPFFALSNLYNGRAGIIAYLIHSFRHGGEVDVDHVQEQIDRLGWHQFGYGDGLLHAGEQLFRLSTDVASGTAGIMLVLAAWHNGTDVTAALLPTAHRRQ
jgi:predicted Ser/Thr protein kinase